MGASFDLGLKGKVALVCGSSAGLGRACAEALGDVGADLVLNGRNEVRLREAVDAVSTRIGRTVRFVAADVTTDDGRRRLLEVCPAPDILVNNAAGPPAGDFREFGQDAWENAVRVSMISPIMMIKSVLDGMVARKWGRIINITSSAVKAPLPLLGLSNGARSGLTGFVAGLAREVAEHGITINNILPGRIETDRLVSWLRKVADSRGITYETTVREMTAANPMRRFGRPEEVGAFCAFLASRQASYVTGQNILVDGGEYPGL